MKKKLLLLIAVALSAGMSVTGAMDAKAGDREIFIPDTHLRQVICDTLGKAYGSVITEDEMLSITELSSDHLPLIESPAERSRPSSEGRALLKVIQARRLGLRHPPAAPILLMPKPFPGQVTPT